MSIFFYNAKKPTEKIWVMQEANVFGPDALLMRGMALPIRISSPESLELQSNQLGIAGPISCSGMFFPNF